MAARAAITALLCLSAGCRYDGERRREPAEEPPAQIPIPAPTLSGSGVNCLAVGLPVASLPPDCVLLSDSTGSGPEGMEERRVHVRIGTDTLAATVVNDAIWRIEITGPAIRTRDGLGVGSDAHELLQRPGSRMIGGEGRLFVVNAGHCGLSFEVSDPRLSGLGADSAAGLVEPGMTVSRVLAFGCSPGLE